MDEPSVEPVTTADYEQIARLLMTFRGQNKQEDFWRERFAFWWDKNPFFQSSMSRGFVLRHAGRVVGFIGTIPLPFWLDGVDRITYTPAAWYVLPEFHASSLKLLFEQLDTTWHTLYWSTTSNQRSRAIFLNMRFRNIPYLFSRQVTVYTSSMTFWHTIALQKKWPTRVQWLLHDLQRFTPSRRSFALEGMRVLPLRHADARFDRLWERTRTANMATRNRSSQWLNWYCFGWNGHSKILLGCFQGDELEGFAVFGHRTIHSGLFWECLDLWCDPASPYCGDALFSAALAAIAKAGGKGLISHDYPAVRGWLERRLWKNAQPDLPHGLMFGPRALCDRIQRGPHYFTFGEGDQGM